METNSVWFRLSLAVIWMAIVSVIVIASYRSNRPTQVLFEIPTTSDWEDCSVGIIDFSNPDRPAMRDPSRQEVAQCADQRAEQARIERIDAEELAIKNALWDITIYGLIPAAFILFIAMFRRSLGMIFSGAAGLYLNSLKNGTR